MRRKALRTLGVEMTAKPSKTGDEETWHTLVTALQKLYKTATFKKVSVSKPCT